MKHAILSIVSFAVLGCSGATAPSTFEECRAQAYERFEACSISCRDRLKGDISMCDMAFAPAHAEPAPDPNPEPEPKPEPDPSPESFEECRAQAYDRFNAGVLTNTGLPRRDLEMDLALCRRAFASSPRHTTNEQGPYGDYIPFP